MDIKKYYKNKKKGFTLVETLIAIAILVVAVLAPLAIAQSGLQGARYAQDQLTAIFLAQEAVELVKSQVYSNMNETPPVDWLRYLNDGSPADCITRDCEVSGPRPTDQSAGLPIRECIAGANACKVYLDTGSNLYTSSFTGDTQTKFTRAIRLTPIAAPTPLNTQEKVTVTVTWKAQDGTSKNYALSDHITNWYSGL